MATWSQAQLDACDAAISKAMTGKTVTFADRSWTSQDLAELVKLRAMIAHSVSSTTAPNYRLAATTKGV